MHLGEAVINMDNEEHKKGFQDAGAKSSFLLFHQQWLQNQETAV